MEPIVRNDYNSVVFSRGRGMTVWRVAAGAILALGLACRHGEPECYLNSDCPGSLICVSDRCLPACKTGKDCAGGLQCVNGTCTAGATVDVEDPGANPGDLPDAGDEASTQDVPNPGDDVSNDPAVPRDDQTGAEVALPPDLLANCTGTCGPCGKLEWGVEVVCPASCWHDGNPGTFIRLLEDVKVVAVTSDDLALQRTSGDIIDVRLSLPLGVTVPVTVGETVRMYLARGSSSDISLMAALVFGVWGQDGPPLIFDAFGVTPTDHVANETVPCGGQTPCPWVDWADAGCPGILTAEHFGAPVHFQPLSIRPLGSGTLPEVKLVEGTSGDGAPGYTYWVNSAWLRTESSSIYECNHCAPSSFDVLFVRTWDASKVLLTQDNADGFHGYEVCVAATVADPGALVHPVDATLACAPPGTGSKCNAAGGEAACGGTLDLVSGGTAITDANWARLKALSLLPGIVRIAGTP